MIAQTQTLKHYFMLHCITTGYWSSKAYKTLDQAQERADLLKTKTPTHTYLVMRIVKDERGETIDRVEEGQGRLL